MKSSPYVVFTLGSIVSCSIIFGQNAPPPEKPATPSEKKQDAPHEKEKSEPGAPLPIKPTLEGGTAQHQPRPGYGRDAMVDRRMAAFVRLRELTFDKVKFDTDKRKKIDVMFDDYMAGLLDPNQRPHVQPRPEDAATPQELPELRKQLEEAEKDGDPEKIATLKAKIYYATIVLEPSVIDEPVFFFDYLNQELNDEQRKEFDPMLHRWRMLRLAEIAPDNDFKQLRRSARDPFLSESEDLWKQLEEILLEALRTVPNGPQRIDVAVMAKLAANTKPKILEKLNPKQREHFEKTLELLKRWEKEDPEIAKKTRERLKDHQPAFGGEKSSIKPPQSPPTQP